MSNHTWNNRGFEPFVRMVCLTVTALGSGQALHLWGRDGRALPRFHPIRAGALFHFLPASTKPHYGTGADQDGHPKAGDEPEAYRPAFRHLRFAGLFGLGLGHGEPPVRIA